jgi:hypothetical protein
VEEVLDVPVMLFGTVDEMVDRLLARRERWGLSYFVVQSGVAREFTAVVARLAVL